MSKIKLTKGELKKQRDGLKQFLHYLPTLQLKKQQLQIKILEVKRQLADREKILNEKLEAIQPWAGLLADSSIDLKEWLTPIQVITEITNIAGANLPVFSDIRFAEAKYDFYSTPLWIDQGLEELRILEALLAEIKIIQKQIAILEQELRITTQRVNLFEKVKIPECQENIRRIRIYLGDQMANAVGISKVAKRKVELRSLEEMVV